MPEQREKLRQTLLELEAELQQIDSLDEASRTLLTDVSRDINELLQRPEPHSDARSVQGRLSASLQDFEVAHPTLFGILHRLVDGLAQLGI